MDGVLFKAKSGRKLHGYLFNDILILAEPLKQLSPKGYLYTLYREPLPLERVSVRQQQSMTLMPSFSGNNNTGKKQSYAFLCYVLTKSFNRGFIFPNCIWNTGHCRKDINSFSKTSMDESNSTLQCIPAIQLDY